MEIGKQGRDDGMENGEEWSLCTFKQRKLEARKIKKEPRMGLSLSWSC